MIRRKLLKSLVTVGFIGVTSFATGANAEQLSHAIGFPAGSIVAKASEAYGEAVEEYSEGELSTKLYPMSLLSFSETSDGLRDGIVDIGLLLAPYFPSQYPHFNMIAESTMMLHFLEDPAGRGGMAYAGAVTEFFFNHCPECLDEFERQNQVFTSSGASTTYLLQCTEPVTSLDDIQGKRISVSGSHWSRWVSEVEASPVSLPGNEIYEALSQGVITCAVQSPPELTNLRLIEPVTDITLVVPGGTFAGGAMTNVNKSVWRRLDASQRQAMLRAGAVMSGEMMFTYTKRHEEALQLAREEGIQIHQPDDDLLEATKDFAREDIGLMGQHYERYGVERATEIMDEFRPILERWIQLVQDVESSEELTELYWREAYGNLDIETYGM